MLASALEADESEVWNVMKAFQNALLLLDAHHSISKPEGTNSVYHLMLEFSG